MCEWKDAGISHEFEKEDVAALFENWREVGRGVGEWEGGCGKGSVGGLGLLVLYLIVLKPFVLILSCSLTPQFSFSIPFLFDIYFFLY